MKSKGLVALQNFSLQRVTNIVAATHLGFGLPNCKKRSGSFHALRYATGALKAHQFENGDEGKLIW